MWEKYFCDSLGVVDSEIVKRMMDFSRTERFKKGDQIVEIGEKQLQIPFLVSGVLRGFVIDENGQDITDCFAWRCGDVVCGFNGLREPSQINIEALSDCELLQVPVSVLEELLECNLRMVQVYNMLLAKALKEHWETKRTLYLGAMQRYQWFLNTYSGLIDRVSNKHIASF